MTTIFFHNFKAPFPNEKWAFYLEQMPVDIQNRIGRYFKEENKYQLLIGRLLLRAGMLHLGYKMFDLAHLFYDEFNCPKWKADIQFNIAHSGNVVACAFSQTTQIGLDIERIRPIQLKDFGHILNAIDYEQLQNASSSKDAFFKIWTIKEAITKAIGKGLAIDVKEIEIYDEFAYLDQQKWYYYPINLKDGYAGHIVSNEPIVKLSLKEMQF